MHNSYLDIKTENPYNNPLSVVSNTELNDWRKIFVLENLKFMLKEFQFVVSLKIWWSMAYNVCHAPIPVTS